MTPYDLNLRHLMALSEIKQLGSLSRAAEAVHLSQPALTQAVVKLEGTLQHRLFDRHRDGITPTPAGIELIDRVDRAAQELAAAFEECRPATSSRRWIDGRAMLLRVSFTHLRAVIAAVQSGNFILANRATGISASAIHRAVRDFEQLSGIILFERRGRSVVPTDGARAIAGAARRAVAEIEAVIADLDMRRGQIGGRLTIGAMPLVRAKLIPEAVCDFHAKQPGATIAIIDGPYSELLARLTAGELDMIVGALRIPNPSPEIVQTPLYKDHFSVVARSDHPLTELDQIDLHDLARYPWIMSGRTAPKRVAWENMFLDMGIPPPPVAVECSSVLAIHGLLFEGDWLALLSPEQVSREVANGGLAILGPPLRGGASMIGVTTRAGWRPSAIQSQFLDNLKARVDRMKHAGLAA
ncbi:LysR family transcriptional regulator [Novosphingobium flavum]|uniref:LysR family transcriptional regulator n=1 Tax=Novosphingobium flavum TaxID=1778672 RepID=A0A7X1FR10_9SPHN|nr:LysR substrate-binding domain-containing protein [Novosphingobium flavum]MBC2665380.1 LysR family transcriptional regulator [Novosphingobium flavum]